MGEVLSGTVTRYDCATDKVRIRFDEEGDFFPRPDEVLHGPFAFDEETLVHRYLKKKVFEVGQVVEAAAAAFGP